MSASCSCGTMVWALRCSMWASFSGFFSGYTRLAITKAQVSVWRLCIASFGNTEAGFGRSQSPIEELLFPSRWGRPSAQAKRQNFQPTVRWCMSNEVEILLVDDSPEDVELTLRALQRAKVANK